MQPTRFCFILVFILFSTILYSQPILSFTQKISGLNAPVDFVHAGDGSKRIFIVEKGGTIKLYDSNYAFIKNFLTIAPISTDGERGLLSMAFHPDYENNRYFFVYYTNTTGGIEIARYRTEATDSNTVDPASKQVIMIIPKPVPYNNHNGGDLNFGPDGNLYFALGDGGSGDDPHNFAQRPDSLWGKMVRINVDNFTTIPYYSIPADNPYATSSDTLHEIWAFGLRNPWRWSFDRVTGDMWIADVGQSAWEEVNFLSSGTDGPINFGWKCYEGNHFRTGPCSVEGTYVPPIFEYGHNATGGVSITGGYVYRGSQYPLLQGYYVTADFQSQRAWLIKPDGTGGFNSWVQNNIPLDAIVSFGENENGELFVVSLTNTVYQVSSTVLVPVKIISFTGLYNNGRIELKWEVSSEIGVQEYIIEYSINGTDFSSAGSVSAANVEGYSFSHPVSGPYNYYYRLKMMDRDGRYEYSKTILIRNPDTEGGRKLFVIPSVIHNGVMNIHLDKNYNAVQLINLEGREVFKERIGGRTGLIRLQVPALSAGQYVVRLIGDKEILTQRVLVSD